MISVIKIVGESFDFRTGTEVPKSIVLSNGKKEVSVFIDDETALAIVSMLADEITEPKEEPPTTPPRRQSPPQIAIQRMEVDPEPPAAPTLAEEPEDDGPGAAFEDQLTGVGSL